MTRPATGSELGDDRASGLFIRWDVVVCEEVAGAAVDTDPVAFSDDSALTY
jgi:hypothetical protein